MDLQFLPRPDQPEKTHPALMQLEKENTEARVNSEQKIVEVKGGIIIKAKGSYKPGRRGDPPRSYRKPSNI